jgi:DNA topoisomerase-3
LYYAAKARANSDWLVGVNASQSLSISAGRGVWSLGRVQTPTLAMICKRFLDNRNFVPVPFWQIRVQTEKAGISFTAISKAKYDDKNTADAIFRLLQDRKMLCVQ